MTQSLTHTPTNAAPAPGLLDRTLSRLVTSAIDRMDTGRITLRESTGVRTLGREDPADPLHANVRVHDARFFRALALGGSLGAGESYIDGHWDCDDLVAFIRIFARDMDLTDSLDYGLARIVEPLRRIRHALRRNTRSGSRRNIGEHYDLGNDFFELFLDPTLAYSCAVFETADASLEAASCAKFDRLCRKLDLRPSDHLLEIGTGWGGFALHAAARYGCRVTTTTISQRQHELATRRVREAGLADRVTVLLRDYRDLDGQYDKLVSIEMIEAVGHEYLPAFFGKCAALLTPGGAAAIQAITVPDHRYESYRRGVDFIRRHVFPGSCVPSLAALLVAAAKSSDLRLVHAEEIGRHYATTLRLWRERFLARADAVRSLGFTPRFIRMWEYYLASCEGAYHERYLGNAQLILHRPRCRALPPGWSPDPA